MHPPSKTLEYCKKSKPASDSESKDLISSLSDEVISHILSFMPTKYAVRTSLLSTRWRTLWTSVPIIDFLSYTQRDDNDGSSGFMDFVDRVLLLHDSTKINKFNLECRGSYNSYRLNSWVCAAIKLNVQELVLSLCIGMDMVELPRSVFTSVNLVVLKLARDVFFRFPMLVFLPSLKVLHLHSLRSLDDDSFKNLISGCPVLEELDIDRSEVDMIRTLCICSSTLKKLNVCNSFCKEESLQYGLTIKAPALEILVLRDFVSTVFEVNELPSLVKANLEISFYYVNDSEIDDEDGEVNDYRNSIVGMLGMISNVKDLMLCDSILEAVSRSSAYNLLLFPNLTHLHMRIRGNQCSILPNLLGTMPTLKVLFFSKVFELCSVGLRHVAPVSALKCLSLETIEYMEFAGFKEEMKLVRYLLGNAVVLKKLTLQSCTRNKKIQTNLKKFPRSSNTCRIEFRYKSRVLWEC